MGMVEMSVTYPPVLMPQSAIIRAERILRHHLRYC